MSAKVTGIAAAAFSSKGTARRLPRCAPNDD